ncbi:MAG: tRNA lysidine(34) synthetase TilS, partial [Acidocella sp.]|nr:tRNA lysidine(34) synthetase TilS [Acidocella sp.]
EMTSTCLAQRGIPARVLQLSGLPQGARLQETARAARYEALLAACRAEACLFLLLGHHAGDQSETVTMRADRGPHGLEGMAGWAARNDVLLLRPLLGVQPEQLRAFLVEQHMAWLEDPSNSNEKFERVRIRKSGTQTLAADSWQRQNNEHAAADFIAKHVVLRPEGFAVVQAHSMPAAALAALLRVVAGAFHSPAQASVRALAKTLSPATLGGVRVARTAKLGGGWLLAREPAACAPAIPANAGAFWDGRYTLAASASGQWIGALGDNAPAFRKCSQLPSLVLRGLPCLRHQGVVTSFPVPCQFTPPYPATSHPFFS